MTPRPATFSIFVISGAMIGTWIAHIPWLKDHLGVSDAAGIDPRLESLFVGIALWVAALWITGRLGSASGLPTR